MYPIETLDSKDQGSWIFNSRLSTKGGRKSKSPRCWKPLSGPKVLKSIRKGQFSVPRFGKEGFLFWGREGERGQPFFKKTQRRDDRSRGDGRDHGGPGARGGARGVQDQTPVTQRGRRPGKSSEVSLSATPWRSELLLEPLDLVLLRGAI